MVYREFILDLYRNPKNRGGLDHPDVTMRALNPHCGDDYTLSAAFDGDVLTDIKFAGSGCAISTAALSLITDKVKGGSKEQIAALQKQDMLDLIEIPISYGREKCALLGLNTIKKMV